MPAASRASKRPRARRVIAPKRAWWSSKPRRMARAVFLAGRLALGAEPGRTAMRRSLSLTRPTVPAVAVVELLFLGGTLERGGGSRAAGHRQLDLVEVAGPDERLVLHRRVPLA